MKDRLLLFLILILICAQTVTVFCSSNEKIDDWQYNATEEQSKGRMPHIGTSMSAPPVAMFRSQKLGFSVGGARDANNFYENIKHGYLPKIKSITYEGVFAQHYFDAGFQSECSALFCPNLFTAVTKNPFTEEIEYYLSAGLISGMKQHDFKRKKLNLVIVLDISGSMSSPFNTYYYDKGRKIEAPKEDGNKSKMQIANESIVAMLSHLTDYDSLGIVVFDDTAYLAKPLRPVKYTDMEAIKRHVLELKPRGGTNWSAGYLKGLSLFKKLPKENKNLKEFENRIIFLTDAMPNLGELSEKGLFGMVKKASEQGIYTTFIGIGVDFNNDLVNAVSKTKGANYFSVHSSKMFKKRMDKEFDYWVTPLVFDLKMELIAEDFIIDAIYGAPESEMDTGTIFYLGTLFPSLTIDNKVKGGIILVRLKKKGKGLNGRIRLSYRDRSGKKHFLEKAISFAKCCYFDNASIRKGILLAEYVSLIQNWLIDARRACNDKVSNYQPLYPMGLKERALIYPPRRPEWKSLKTWERRSCPLKVSQGYKKLFAVFSRHFQQEAKALKDTGLSKELGTLRYLANMTKDKNDTKEKTDDWQLDETYSN